MKIIKLFIAIIFCFCVSTLSAKGKKIGESTYITAYKLETPLTIDGKLNESVYSNAAISSFTQKDPIEGGRPSESTKVWISYNENAIFVSAKLYDDNADLIEGQLTRRDDDNQSDWFKLFLDPHYDRRSGYYFCVNPAGSIKDGIMYNDSWDDNSWNGIWDYSVQKSDDGWSVEIEIPFTQLRFNESKNMKWGINFSRVIQRKNESDYFIMIPKNESGFVSHFATLEGLNGIKPKQRIEILPYLVQKAQYLVHDENDPFYKSNQYKTTLGADLKIGLGSNLTLDGTINPDFGQVEVDPAVVNLSAFETYYDEKRPFFIEGSNIFSFGYGGSNNNWGFNWGNPEIFYSRRIGRSPHGSVDGEYTDVPNETRILGAAKITGKTNNNWSIGALTAVTERTFGRIYDSGNIIKETVEPLTYYGVVRTQKEFNEGKEGLGIIANTTLRDINNPNLSTQLSDRSFVYGMDGWITLDDDETYVLTGYVSGSYVHGNKKYITDLQEAPLRYYQRPDATYATLDTNRTSLSGYVGRITLNKQKGNFYINSALAIVSPGYEVNDLGFQWRADVINSHLVLGYRWYEPDKIFRNKSVNIAHYRNYNFEGKNIAQGEMVFTNLQLLNYWGINFQGGYFPEAYSNRLTRGGPMAKTPGGASINYDVYSDDREKIVGEFYGGNTWDHLNGTAYNYGIDIKWKPSSQINFSFGPFYEAMDEKMQWVGNFEDPTAVNTYGNRYVFAELNQETIGGSIRMNWTFTPTLSLQLYLQPLFSVGKYTNYKELSAPGTYNTRLYTPNNSTVKYDNENEEYSLDPDGNGPASNLTFSNPDFNFKSLRGNIVLRWEFLPGSVFFLVWTHGQVNTDNPGELSLSRDFRNLWNSEADNVFLAKFTYWINM